MITMNPTVITHQVSPLRILRALCFRLRGLNPHDMVPTIIEHQCDREAAALGTVARETTRIETGLDRASKRLHAALNDKESPGIITLDEARLVARTLVGTKGVAAQHRQHLEHLAQ